MKKIIFILISIIFFGSTYWLDLSFWFFSKLLKTKISQIHYYNGSDELPQNTLWTLIIKQIDYLDDKKVIELWAKKIYCSAIIRWYYMNMVRWNYVLPLTQKDNDSFVKILNWDKNIWLTWWLYTACDGLWDAIYGQIQYTYNDNNWYKLNAGFKYEMENNNIDYGWFVRNFELTNWINPVWFIYDELWWVWFVWWFLWWYKVSKIQTSILDKVDKDVWLDIEYSWTNLIVNWINVWWGNGFHDIVKSIVWIKWWFHLSDWNFVTNTTKNFIYKQSFVNENKYGKINKIAYNMWNEWMLYKVKNKVRKNAEELCRWKWKDISLSEVEYWWTNRLEDINCLSVKDSYNSKVIIDYNIEDTHPVLITKWDIDVVIKKSMKNNGYIQLYIWRGRLLIDDDIDLQNINKYWDIWTPAVTSWAFIKWIFVVNWLLWWYKDNKYSAFSHKLYVDWMFTSLNTISVPKDTRIVYINNLLWWTFTKKDINLLDIFKWRCQDNWIGTDGNNCWNHIDKWWQNSIIFRPNKYNSILLK